jgi:hypothetical protein
MSGFGGSAHNATGVASDKNEKTSARTTAEQLNLLSVVFFERSRLGSNPLLALFHMTFLPLRSR